MTELKMIIGTLTATSCILSLILYYRFQMTKPKPKHLTATIKNIRLTNLSMKHDLLSEDYPEVAEPDVIMSLENEDDEKIVTLLGSACTVSKECTLKVQFSACLQGICRCTEGHMQFNEDICVSPAHPGQVCFSNDHCRLGDKHSHCEFIIPLMPNRFGRCACNSFYRQFSEKCAPLKLPSYGKSQTVKSVAPMKRLPVLNRRYRDPNKTISMDNLTANNQPLNRRVTQPSLVEKKGNKKVVQRRSNLAVNSKRPGIRRTYLH